MLFWASDMMFCQLVSSFIFTLLWSRKDFYSFQDSNQYIYKAMKIKQHQLGWKLTFPSMLESWVTYKPEGVYSKRRAQRNTQISHFPTMILLFSLPAFCFYSSVTVLGCSDTPGQLPQHSQGVRNAGPNLVLIYPSLSRVLTLQERTACSSQAKSQTLSTRSPIAQSSVNG